jgi:lysophospholipase L1-like esterase
MFLIIMGAPGVDDSQTQPLKATGETYNDDARREYENITRTHAQENGHPFVEVYEPLGGEPLDKGADRQKIDPKYMSYDKLHINGSGHKVVYDLLLPTLLGFLVVTSSIKEVSTNGNNEIARRAMQAEGVILHAP